MADPPIKVEKTLKFPKKNGPHPNKKKDKFGRKRSQSFTGIGNGKFNVPYIYRKRPILPTKFLLGGNICDPLNLNSLQDAEFNRTVNAVTPKSSPIPTPPQRKGQLEVIIPPNIHDPLNLDCSDDAEYEMQLTSPIKRGTKRRKKKKRTSSATTEPSDIDEAITPDKSLDSAKIPEIGTGENSLNEQKEFSEPPTKIAKVTKDLKLDIEKAATVTSGENQLQKSPTKEKKRKSFDNKFKRSEAMDKIVSPVVPQPGTYFKRPKPHKRVQTDPRSRNQKQNEKKPDFKEKNKAYQFGNYNRYYGYRNPNHEVDPRLRIFHHYRHLFQGRDILDIGCNIGHITLSIARDFGAKSIVGLDIDKKLIAIARKNVRHYVTCCESPRPETQENLDNSNADKCFPISMPILYGPVDIPGMPTEKKGKGFPHNVTFVQGNYILAEDTLLLAEQKQFDIILCLSVTKWLHLNWGDSGLKQAFRRMYAQLKPGGKLILEPQSWKSYKAKKTLTETIYNNYNSIEFFPEKFTQYLLSSEVGFAKSEIMGHPHHPSKGFQRPIQIFTKSDLSPEQSQRSSATPQHTKNVYTNLISPTKDFDETNYNPKNTNLQSEVEKMSLETNLDPKNLKLKSIDSNECNNFDSKNENSKLDVEKT